MNTLDSILGLIRWKNLIFIFFTQMVSIFLFLSPDTVENNIDLIVAVVVSGLIISASGYVINDYFDVKIDQINKPERVYIGQSISRRQALLFHQILNAIGVIIGLFFGLKILIINVLAISLLWFYASMLKKKPFIGNLIVAFLLALLLIEFAWLFEPYNLKIWLFAFWVFMFNLIREIIKDIEDIDGDKAHGARTLPIIYGLQHTKSVVYSIGTLILALSTVSIVINGNNRYYPILLGIFLFLGFVFYQLKKADRKVDFKNLSIWTKYFLILGLFASFYI